MPVIHLPRCAECNAKLPAPKKTGRPRRFCSDECRYAAKARRPGLAAWHAGGDQLAELPVDPLTQQRRAMACVAETLQGRPAAPPEDQLQQALVELLQLVVSLRRVERELPRPLAGRAGGLARDIHDALVEAFPILLGEETA